MGALSPCSCDDLPALGGDRLERVFGDFGTCEHRRPLVQQAGQAADDPGLRLAALSQEDDVLIAEESVGQLRDHGVVVAGDSGKQRLAGLEYGQ